MNLAGHPIHPWIPTRRFVRPNQKYPNDCITNTQLYKQYPFKQTPSGKRSAIVQANELTDFEYSLTQAEWSEIIASYGKHLQMYLLKGNKYRIPYRRLGDIELVKRKRRTRFFPLWQEGKKYPFPKSFISTQGYKLNIIWSKRRFKFKRIWAIYFTNIYDKLNENTDLIHRLNDR